MQGQENNTPREPIYRASIAATNPPPIAANPPATSRPAPAVTTAAVLELVAEPVDEGLVAVVRVVWAPLAPVGARVLEVMETDPDVVPSAFSSLEVLVAAVEEEVEAAEVLLATLLRVVLLLLTVEVVVEPLPAVIWKGKLYWKMVVLESSWSFRPYVAYPAMLLSGVHVNVPRALSMLAVLGCQ